MDTLLIVIAIIISSYILKTKHILKNWGKYESISGLYTQEEYESQFRIGLIFTGILQILFVLSLISSGSDNYYFFKIGRVVFLLGAVGSIGMGFFLVDKKRILHFVFAYLYFIGLFVGALFISLNFVNSIENLILFGGLFFFMIIYSLIYRKRSIYKVEGMHVMLSYVWLIIIVLINL